MCYAPGYHIIKSISLVVTLLHVRHGQKARRWVICSKNNLTCAKFTATCDYLSQILLECSFRHARVPFVSLPDIAIVHAKLHKQNMRGMRLNIVWHSFQCQSGCVSVHRGILDYYVERMLVARVQCCG